MTTPFRINVKQNRNFELKVDDSHFGYYETEEEAEEAMQKFKDSITVIEYPDGRCAVRVGSEDDDDMAEVDLPCLDACNFVMKKMIDEVQIFVRLSAESAPKIARVHKPYRLVVEYPMDKFETEEEAEKAKEVIERTVHFVNEPDGLFTIRHGHNEETLSLSSLGDAQDVQWLLRHKMFIRKDA